jgi:formylglycine-generating enzyme required for sulfatase activity
MKKPKRKQHLIFSALEGITEVQQPPLPSSGALTPMMESEPMPSVAQEITRPDPFAEQLRPQAVSSVPADPGLAATDETPLAPPAPETAGSEPLAEEPTPQVSSTALSEPDAVAPDATTPLTPAPEILRADRPEKQQVPQSPPIDSTALCKPALSQLPSPAPEVLVTGPRFEEPRSPGASTPLGQSGVLPHLHFVEIPPGMFFMGSPESEAGRGTDEVLHQVTLTQGFSLQATPVTQALWLAVMGTNPSVFTQDSLDQPVENVSWNECQEFIQRINCMGNDHYRLPTEAEWEYACRAATTTACAGGKLIELQGGLDPVLDALGWYCANSGATTHAVAGKQPNAWGFYDLHGNVMEWCQDGYAPYGDIRMHKVQGEWVTTTNERIDPVGLPEAKARVVRGGSWISTGRQCRSAARLAWPAGGRSNFIGLRLVRE